MWWYIVLHMETQLMIPDNRNIKWVSCVLFGQLIFYNIIKIKQENHSEDELFDDHYQIIWP